MYLISGGMGRFSIAVVIQVQNPAYDYIIQKQSYFPQHIFNNTGVHIVLSNFTVEKLSYKSSTNSPKTRSFIGIQVILV